MCPLSRDGAPVEVALLVGILQETEARRVRTTKGQGGLREPLQDIFGRRRHLSRQFDQGAALGFMVGRTRGSSAQLSHGKHGGQVGRWLPTSPAALYRGLHTRLG